MTQEFLNEKQLPFDSCTREQQHILMDAWLDGKSESWDYSKWGEVTNTNLLNCSWILRTKPIKRLAIPWEHIKPEYKFARLTSKGKLYFYSHNPEIQAPYTFSESSDALNIDVTGIDWKDSLVERPADK
jgi:hypothetical protein